MKTCVHCGKEVREELNYCGWDCIVAESQKNGYLTYCPNGLPTRCSKPAHGGLLLEHEHADHRDYRFPVSAEYIGTLPELPEWDDSYAAEEHALIYADDAVAVTLYECCYAMWSLNDGLLKSGSLWEKGKWRLSLESIAKIRHPWFGHKEPLWKVREKLAQAVNCLPTVDGSYTWKCETCGDEWKELDNTGYDRTKDTSNWPVMCSSCHEEWMKKVNDDRQRRDDVGRIPDTSPTIG